VRRNHARAAQHADAASCQSRGRATLEGLSGVACLFQPRETAGKLGRREECALLKFSARDRTADERLSVPLAASGLLVVAIDVRLASEAPYPASVADANYGIRWLKAQARAWHGDPETLGALDTASQYSDANGREYIDAFAAYVDSAQAWRVTSTPVRISGQVTVTAPITITAGATFLFAQHANLVVTGNSGSLRAVGTPSAKIQFLGEVATPGFWQVLVFDSSEDANELTHTEVAHGGGGGRSDAANVRVTSWGRLRLTNSTLWGSAGWGLHVAPAGVVAPLPIAGAGNSFSGNARGNSNVP
jgi:hypothetical protein